MPFLSTPGLRIHYEHGGAGSTVLVLVHGNVGSWRWWQPIMENPPAGVTVYAPEIRGYGDSEHTTTGHTIEQYAADLLTFIDALGVNKFFLVGHSLGGAVALQFALHNQQKIHSLLLVSPAPAEGMPHLARDPQSLFGMTMKVAESSYFQLFAKKFNLDRAFYSRALMMITPMLDHTTPFFGTLVDDAVRTSADALKGSVASLIIWNVSGLLSGLKAPVVVIFGEKERVVKRDALERMVNALPSAKLVVWEKVGHAPQLEDPERFWLLLSELVSAEITSGLAQKKAEKASEDTDDLWPKIGRVGIWRKIGSWLKEKVKGGSE